MDKYIDFLKNKEVRITKTGFDINDDDMNPFLFDFQKYCVKKALKVGRFALFENCGLGKTIQQLEWSLQVSKHIGKPVLILSPLSVVPQTINEGSKFGYTINEIENEKVVSGIYITNYENLDNIDTDLFGGIVLDESSILKNFDGKTKQKIIDSFKNTPYKLACTATPSPNDTMELCNHAEFLNVMNRNEMLAMYFVHDGGSTSSWRLKGHAQTAFWDFVSTWAIMIIKPDDIGFNGDKYILPELNIQETFIRTKKRDNGMLFEELQLSAQLQYLNNGLLMVKIGYGLNALSTQPYLMV